MVSTVLGLIPFLMEGTNEVFWFAFAVGTMSGLLLSLLALVFVMPSIVKLKWNVCMIVKIILEKMELM